MEGRKIERGAQENEASVLWQGMVKKSRRGSFCRKLNDNTSRYSLERFQQDKGSLLGRVRNESTRVEGRGGRVKERRRFRRAKRDGYSL